MKSSAVTTNNNLFESKDNKSNNSCVIREQTFWCFNAVAGLIILFALFSIFVLFFVFILDVLAIEMNILPVAVAVVLCAAAGIIVFIASHTIETVIKLINNGNVN